MASTETKATIISITRKDNHKDYWCVEFDRPVRLKGACHGRLSATWYCRRDGVTDELGIWAALKHEGWSEKETDR